ncbi:MAG: ComF family protein, partial [Peptococcaceae bacterium]|nr:ComF family protein [Peptococcaceae bacterium]
IGCVLCGKKACECWELVLQAYHTDIRCDRCGKLLSKPGICQDCTLRSPGFPDRVFTLALYEGHMREALHRLKYRGDKRAGLYLGELLAAGPGREVLKPDLIIPVPLHPKKRRKRGYNQALILGISLAQTLKVPLKTNMLYRVAYTHAQADLGRQERMLNLGKAFVAAPHGLGGKNVLLIDDILTTGFTLELCGSALRQAGVTGLQAVCVAAGRDGR